MNVDAKLMGWLRDAEATLLFTGAGVSTGSGIPDYRGPLGVWRKHQPVYFQEFLLSETARIAYWEYKLETWECFRDAEPNPVHHAAVAIEKAGKLLLCVTQNVDGLHLRAGTSKERLVELHGSNLEIECIDCGTRSDPAPHFQFFSETHDVPRCCCGGLLKPATISFGQNLREEDLEKAFASANVADLVIAMGTTLSVTPAANIPLAAAQRGIPYVVINRGPTEHDGFGCVSLRLDGDVDEIFPLSVAKALQT